MRIVIFLQGTRGRKIALSLGRVGYDIVGEIRDKAVGSSFYVEDSGAGGSSNFFELEGRSVNHPSVLEWLRGCDADIFVIGGSRYILSEEVLSLPSIGTVGVHGGRLPEYRGSSPMNWAILRGCYSHWLTVMTVETGVDKGAVLEEKQFPIGLQDDISTLHERADQEFPSMVVSVIDRIAQGECDLKKSRPREGGRYLPLRFPEDGVINWQSMGAWQIHNMVRGLSRPYPCASSVYRGVEVRFLSSRLMKSKMLGEPARIYKIENDWIQVGTKDYVLWLRLDRNDIDITERYSRFD